MTRSMHRLANSGDLGGDHFWFGGIASLHIWNRALSTIEIGELFDLGRHHCVEQSSEPLTTSPTTTTELPIVGTLNEIF